MALGPTAADAAPSEPDIDENGVDRAQIRAMLQLTAEERLRRVEEFVASGMEAGPTRTCSRRRSRWDSQAASRSVC